MRIKLEARTDTCTALGALSLSLKFSFNIFLNGSLSGSGVGLVHDGRDSLIGLIVVIECHNSMQVILNSLILSEVFRQYMPNFIMTKFITYRRIERLRP